ncbi:glycerate kinase [Mammaliicoccus fleurettii]|uniref:glycerate kinase n=1 Tax=Mammaliicoccus fleurettii TaxID=150056 RepID=UPI000993BB17|nr:glycerate kinase [Mammaliicoccus fleurettii]MBO3062610.1 glycerate kinase [Mammaliicoccus fleurettii]MEB7723274.1 glycerate kinase [Mammaliicoccus fleurettii]MEB8067164.1 glycerate kinase [Mammaliicoccus fleurettii]OOV79016.1 glycerate kinase [Mammaliicoccus fleurettii]
MKVLIAPDSFKGSSDALTVAHAMQNGILKVDSKSETVIIPMADGGEGTMINLVQATNGTVVTANSVDPLGRQMESKYGISGDGKTAIIELATSSGIDLLNAEELNPLKTTTYGTGMLIKDALERNIKHFIICLGGSATNDAGVGLLQALGFRFLDKNGLDINLGGQYIKDIVTIDDSNVMSLMKEANFEIACDVTNPLIGTNGASYIFGPQKGASVEAVKILDNAIEQFANIIEQQKNLSIHQIEGAGAAGGTAGSMLAFLNANLKRGIELVIDFVELNEMLKQENFDLIITGEGKIDGQTAGGKVISGMCQKAHEYGIPIIALGGSVEGNLSELYNQGLTAAYSITNGPMNLEEAMQNSSCLIEQQTEQIFRTIKMINK